MNHFHTLINYIVQFNSYQLFNTKLQYSFQIHTIFILTQREDWTKKNKSIQIQSQIHKQVNYHRHEFIDKADSQYLNWDN